MDDLISRKRALEEMTFSCGIEQDGVLYVPLRDVDKHLKNLPSVQLDGEYDPEPDIYYLAEKIGIHRLYALVVQLRGEPDPCIDTIGRQAAIDALLELVEARRTWISTEDARKEISGIDASMCAIHDLPSVQPEIIICLDCVHYEPLGKEKAWGRCSVHSSPTDNQRFVQSCDFCAWAERKTDD